jgi:hypothetical protein
MKVIGIQCPRCQEQIWSRHGHDMRYCGCGFCYIDGGRRYTRVGYGGPQFQEPWESPTDVEIEIE